MLVIRLQRTGRTGHAMFRIIVQDSRRSPTSGKVVASLGHYDPHTKKVSLDKEKASQFLNNGAQPSDRVISLLKAESVKLPSWVSSSPAKDKSVKSPEKRRSTAPEPTEKPVEAEAETQEPDEASETTPAETSEQPEAEASETPETADEAKSEASEELPEASDAPAEPEAEATEEKPEETPEAPSKE